MPLCLVALASGRPQPTARELLVLQLLARGMAASQAAHLLDIPIVNVVRLIRSAVASMSAGSLPEAIEIARQRRLID